MYRPLVESNLYIQFKQVTFNDHFSFELETDGLRVRVQ